MIFFLTLIAIGVFVYYMNHIAGELNRLDRKIDRVVELLGEDNRIRSNGGVFDSQMSSEMDGSNIPAPPIASSLKEESYSSQDVAHSNDTSEDIFVDHTLEPQQVASESLSAQPLDAKPASGAASPFLSHDVPADNGLSVESVFHWLQHDWPLKIGGLLIILAAGWFITYAAAEGWLSESARVVIGYVFGVSALVYGTLRVEKVRLQGNIFLLIGVAVIFVSTLAAVNFESVLMPSTLALVVMLITVAFVSLISLKQDNQGLTGAMIAFGAFVPLAFFDNGLDIQFIFAYLFVLTLGTLWIVYMTSWRKLTALMLGVVALYSIGHAVVVGNAQNWSNMILAFAFGAVFYAANVRAIISEADNQETDQDLSTTDYVTAIGITLMYLVWVYLYGPAEYRVVLLLLGVVLFVGASYGIFSAIRVKTPTVVYGAAAFILIVIATAEVADGAILVTAYIVESAVAIALGIYALGNRMTTRAQMLSGILFCLPLLMLLTSISKGFTYIQNKDFARYGLDLSDVTPHLLAIFVAAASSIVLAILVRINMNLDQQENRQFMRFFAAVGLILSVVLIWLVTHTFMGNSDVATFVSLFIYVAVGAYFYVLGARNKYKPYQIVGVALFGIVLADIFFVEFWEMPQAIRIITAFVVGVVFIITAYIARSRGQKHI